MAVKLNIENYLFCVNYPIYRFTRYRLKSNTRAALALCVKSAIGADTDRKRLALGLPFAHAGATAGQNATNAAERIKRLASLIRGVRESLRGTAPIPKLPEYPKLEASSNLKELIKQTEHQKKEQQEINSAVEQLAADLEERLGGRCPTCGTILSDQTLV